MSGSIDKLLAIMAALRDPDTGCPWDVKQDFGTIAPYTIEEAYEVDDAIQRGDMDDLREELGDLLLQVVFHAQMASEADAFRFDDVVEGICDKMVQRHPHVFGHGRDLGDTELREAWELTKETERRRKGNGAGALDGVALSLPALLRSQKLIKRAARKGFRWPSTADALDKCSEELEELREAVEEGSRARMEEELGDLLLACAGVAGRCGLDPEKAMRLANRRFEARFRRVEASLQAEGKEMEQTCVEDLVRLWERAGSESG